jgi:hypothetical protein
VLTGLTRRNATILVVTILAISLHLLAFQVEKSSPDMNTWLTVGRAASLGQDFYKAASPTVTELPYWYPPLWGLVLGALGLMVNPESSPVLYALILRLLLMAADLAAGFMLLRWFKVGLFYFAFWLLNPLVIATAQSGQFDIVPALFTLLALVAHRNDRGHLSGFLLGVGFAFKFWPVVAVPLLIVDHRRDQFRYAWKVLLSTGVTIAASCLPFLYTTQFAFNVANSWLIQGPLSRIGLGLGPVPILVAATILLVIPGFVQSRLRIELVWILGFIMVLVLTLFTLASNTYIQYSLWSLPFLVIIWAQSRSIMLGAMTNVLWLLYVLERYGQLLAKITGVTLNIGAYIFQGAYFLLLLSLLWILFDKHADRTSRVDSRNGTINPRTHDG